MSSRNFSKIFYLIFLGRFFLSFRAFCWEQERWKSFGASSKYGGWYKTKQPKSNIFFPHDFSEYGLALLWRKTMFLPYRWVQLIFFKDFHAHAAVIESIRYYWLSDCCLKTPNGIILQWSYNTHSITFLPWNTVFGVGCKDWSLLITAFYIENYHKRPIFCYLLWYSWENGCI